MPGDIRQGRRRGGFIKGLVVGLAAVICVPLILVLPRWHYAKATSGVPAVGHSVGWPLIKAGEAFDADVAPSDQTPALDRDFGGTTIQRNYVSGNLLTLAGYPWATIASRVPACSDPYDGKDAEEAWKASDMRWMNTLSDCYILDAGLRVEWIKYDDDLQLGQTTVRVKTSDGGRAVLYIPALEKDGLLESPLFLTPLKK